MYNGVYTIEQYAYMHDTLVKWLSIRIHGKTLGDKLLEKEVKVVAVYGVNGFGQMVYQDIQESKVEVLGYVDRNASQYPHGCNGLEVFLPEQIEELPSNCYILVTPEYYFYEIMNDLLGHGIALERIISLSMVV